MPELQLHVEESPCSEAVDPTRRQRLRHDLRQSVGTVMSLMAIVEHDGTRVPEVLRRLDQVKSEADWMATLVSSYGPAASDIRAVDVGDAVAQVWASAAAATSCGLQLTRDASVSATVDVVELARAARNLIDNAVRAAGPDGRVVVEVRGGGSAVAVVVHDNGPGFGNVPTQQGLGLVTVRRFAAACGGRLDVDRGIDGGTIVTLLLPRTQSSDLRAVGG